MLFKWKDAFSCNIREIDEQHQKLFKLGSDLNHLISLKDEFDRYDEIVGILNELKEYTSYHFNFEEQLMEKYNFKELDEHKRAHEAFINKLNEIYSKDIDANQSKVTMDIVIFIADWIEQHILKTDQRYKTFLNEKGIF
ncbi:MAG: hemerythrin [Clostridiales bacterium]|jgi:hemerythrin|nr:hemerythrin [Clostridiales bacterium]MDK2934796.1 hemerythrin [Clostridiales bacterium]